MQIPKVGFSIVEEPESMDAAVLQQAALNGNTHTAVYAHFSPFASFNNSNVGLPARLSHPCEALCEACFGYCMMCDFKRVQQK